MDRSSVAMQASSHGHRLRCEIGRR
jgi:hypothetical protein